MGRGRQKAKHMKVARRLKYYSPETDLDALQRELAGSDDQLVDAKEDADSPDADDGDWAVDSWSTEETSDSDDWEDYR